MLCECEGQSQGTETVGSNMKETTQAELKVRLSVGSHTTILRASPIGTELRMFKRGHLLLLFELYM